MRYSGRDIAKLLWLLSCNILSIGVFALVLFELPATRLEEMIILTGAATWWLVTGHSMTSGTLALHQLRFTLGGLRAILPHIRDTYTNEEWEQHQQTVEEQVWVEDLERYSPAQRRPLRLSQYRILIEEEFYDVLRRARFMTRDGIIASVFWLVEGGLLLVRLFTLTAV